MSRNPLLCWDRQRIRDVPRTCICTWEWALPVFRWVRAGPVQGCPWHSEWAAYQPEVRQP
jgi:hypothetical protein